MLTIIIVTIIATLAAVAIEGMDDPAIVEQGKHTLFRYSNGHVGCCDEHWLCQCSTEDYYGDGTYERRED